MATAPGWSDAAFFSNRDGQIYEVNLKSGSVSEFFDLTVAGVAPAFEVSGPRSGRGLRGLAFHPDFNAPGRPGYGKFYTAQQEMLGSGPATRALDPAWASSSVQDSVVVEWTFAHALGAVDATSYRQVYRVQMPYGDHVLQQIAFNPATPPEDPDYGLLYIPIGDGGGPQAGGPGVDGNRVGQSTTDALAAIVRIDPLADGGQPFRVPATNPFVDDPGTLDEIYAYGFRHPQTIGFDPADGRLFSGDISQNNIEEINLVIPAANYGWGVREGTYLYTDQRLPADGQQADTSLVEVLWDASQTISIARDDGTTGEELIASRMADAFTYPVTQFDHLNNEIDGRSAVAGGYVARGALAPELEGLYLFGNLSTDQVFYVAANQLVDDQQPVSPQLLEFRDAAGTRVEVGELIGAERTLMRFGQDARGEVYLFSQLTGQIFRLGPAVTPGDNDRDGDVDGDDFLAWQAAYLIDTGGDADGDGDTDGLDFLLWQQNYTTPPAAVTVPEPAALIGTLLIAAVSSLSARPGH